MLPTGCNLLSSKCKIATFLYHDVADDPSESGFQRRAALPYKQTRLAFARHMEGIARSGFTPGTVPEIDFGLPEKKVLITFDDGGKSAVHAADELSRRGWKGHFFITTSQLGTRTFLDANETRYLHSCGHVIGSHSHTHPDIFKGIPYEQMIREWRTSCDLLSDLLGAPCVTGSVPGGDVSRLVYRSANEAGLKFLFTSDPILTPKQEGSCWIVGRICPKTDAPLAYIQKLAEFRGWSAELFRRRAKTAVKTSFFPLYRIYVRYAIAR